MTLGHRRTHWFLGTPGVVLPAPIKHLSPSSSPWGVSIVSKCRQSLEGEGGTCKVLSQN